MAYNNLRAEMARSGLRQKHLAKAIDVSIKGISDRLCGRQRFKLNEAQAIRDSFFKEKTIDYLFSEDKP